MTTSAVLGALAFESAAARRAALDRAGAPLLPAMNLRVCSAQTREILTSAQRGERLLVFDTSLSFTGYDELAPRVYQLAEASVRGLVGLVQGGQSPELQWAEATSARWSDELPERSTTDWLQPSNEPMRVERRGGEPLEFAWTRVQGLPALDVRDWCGFFGVLVERDHRLYFGAPDLTGALEFFEWANLAHEGATGLVAFSHKELLVSTEVCESQPLSLATRRYELATRVVVTRRLMPSDPAQFGSLEVAPRATSVWFARGHGIVSIG